MFGGSRYESMKKKQELIHSRMEGMDSAKLSDWKGHYQALATQVKVTRELGATGPLGPTGCCCEFTPITQADLPLTITEPGKYIVQEDLEYIPDPLSGPFGNGQFTPAINVLSNDVVIDFCEHTLKQADATPETYGVQIGEEYFYSDPDAVLDNVTIQNGTVRDFTAIGIFAYNGSFDGGAGELSFSNLHVLDMNVLNCGALEDSFYFGNGISFDSAAFTTSGFVEQIDQFAFRNVIIQNCKANDCKGSAGIQIYTVSGIVIENSQANNLRKTSDANGTACFAISTWGENINIFNCQGNNVSYESGTSQCGGLDCELSTNLLVKDSQFNNAFGEDAVIVNSNLSLNLNDVYINSQFNGARGGKTARIICGVHRSSGIFQIANGKGAKYINCQFNGSRVDPENQGGDPNCEVGGFFSIATNGDTFENCEFSNHDVGTNDNFSCVGCLIGTQAYAELPGVPGIGGNYCQTFKNCRFNDIRGGYRTGGLIVVSNDLNLVDPPPPLDDTRVLQKVITDIIIENCSASRIYSNSERSQLVFGLMEGLWPDFFSPRRPIEPAPVIDTYFPKMINLQIKDCRVSNVRSAKIPRVSGGIVVESVTNPELSGNSVADCDRGILLTGVNKIIPNGFQLAATKELSLACPPQFLTLTDPLPDAAPLQTFTNLTQGNSVEVSPVEAVAIPGTNIPSPGVSTLYDMIFPAEDLNVLGWKAGDQILYSANGGSNISGLVSGTTYSLVVYVPGFSECGLVQDNKVSNCSLSGFQDDKAPHTSSAWLSNTGFNNGPDGKNNYQIGWSCHKPVAKGSLKCYPKPKYWTENVSISKSGSHH